MSNDIVFAHYLADIADSLTMTGFRSENQGVRAKEDRSPVCDVDLNVQVALSREILSQHPQDAILGEEDIHQVIRTPQSFEHLWIIDPIDQTRHYLRGNPEFATLLARQTDGAIDVAMISAPALGVRWWATRGTGAFRNGQRLAVSKVKSLQDAYVAIAGHREWLTDWNWLGVKALLDCCSYPCGCSGGFLPQMQTAEGLIDIFIEPWGAVWDHAAPSLIVEEAGGNSSTLDGSPSRGGSLLVSNGLLHSKTLEILAGRLGST